MQQHPACMGTCIPCQVHKTTTKNKEHTMKIVLKNVKAPDNYINP